MSLVLFPSRGLDGSCTELYIYIEKLQVLSMLQAALQKSRDTRGAGQPLRETIFVPTDSGYWMSHFNCLKTSFYLYSFPGLLCQIAT